MKNLLTTKIFNQVDLIGMLAATVCMIHYLIRSLFIVAKSLLLPSDCKAEHAYISRYHIWNNAIK